MEGFELIAVVVFFLIGYWVVDFFWPKKKSGGIAVPPIAGVPDDPPWHEVLGVRPDATAEEIREAYLAKSAEHHPDRVFSQGADAREAAMRMTRKLNDAYEKAARERP